MFNYVGVWLLCFLFLGIFLFVFFVCFDVFVYSCYILKYIGYILMYKYVDFSYEVIVGGSLIEYLILIIK